MTEKTDDLFNEENVPESNWFKFEKVGDRVSGELVEVEDKEGSGDFGPQRVFTLKQADGELMNVGIAMSKDYVITRASKAKMGDLVGFEFKKEIPAKVKGHHAAKSIEVYVKHVEKSDDEISADDIPM